MLKEGLTPAVLEARYRKRLERIIAKYFLRSIFTYTRPCYWNPALAILRGGETRTRSPYMKSAMNCRVTSNYFLLLQCSHEQNGAAD